MRQAMAVAGMHIGSAIGVRIKAWQFHQKVDMNERQICEEALKYVELANELFEAAEEVAMSKPDNGEYNVFNRIGSKFCEFIREHSKLPTEEEMLALMINATNYFFEDIVSSTQKESLLRVLNAYKE